MDLTAQGIRDVAFREKLRGYHPDDVDAFVEQVAAAFDQLEQKVRDFEAVQARSAADAVTEETLRRTLIMAQRTADMVTAEANAAAARLVDEAQREADTLLAEANDTVQHSIDEAQQRVELELGELKEARRLLQDDVAALQEYVAAQHAALRTALVEQLAALDADNKRQLAPPPQVHHVGQLPAVAGVAPARAPEAAPPPVPPQPASDIAAFAKSDNGSTVPEMATDDLMARGRQIESRLPRAGEEDPFLAELRRAVDEDMPAHPDSGPQGVSPAAIDVASPFSAPGVDQLDDAHHGSADVAEDEQAPGRLFRRR